MQLYPDSLRTRKKELAKDGEQDPSSRSQFRARGCRSRVSPQVVKRRAGEAPCWHRHDAEAQRRFHRLLAAAYRNSVTEKSKCRKSIMNLIFGGTRTMAGLILILLGTVYLLKPTLFRRWFWMKTSIAIQLLSEKNYIRYMRGLGIIFIIGGVAMIVWD